MVALLLLSLVIATSANRISPTTIPSKYDINLNIPRVALEGGVTQYTGSVNIVFRVTEPKNTVVLHSLVNIISIVVTNTVTSTDPQVADTIIGVEHTNYTVDSTTETVTILFPTDLAIATDYNLNIAFIGALDTVNTQGFYRSQYLTNGVTEYLAITQFQPTHARRAFPCFDEPQYKATFILSLTYRTGFEASANTPIDTTNPNPADGTTTTVFRESPIMSSYLLAFTVSKFTCTNTTGVSPSVFNVCSRTDLAADRVLAADSGFQILTAMDTWTNYPYSTMNLGKMTQVAVPDFRSGAMENWGLVTYREYLLLNNNIDTSNKYKQSILSVIAHEFAHMWFGNLVTTEWWDSLFLNEGFATYFEFFLLNQIPDLVSYEMGKQFIVQVQQLALSADASLSSPSLTSEAATTSEIWSKFSLISYQKGGSILRMVENLIGPTVFQTALRQYLTQNPYSTATPAVLWNAVSTAVPTGIFPAEFTFLEFIDNWTHRSGFPLVTATLSGNNVVLTQRRFLYSGTNDTQWYVPINYRTANSNVNGFIWLQPNSQSVTLENAAANNGLVIINPDAVGYYRVHYDNTLRERIISTLANDHEQISDLSRAQIVDDVLNLARANVINYSEALQVIDYLRKETSYYPWVSALSGLDYVFSSLRRDSEAGRRVDNLLLGLIETVSANVLTTNWDTVDHITSLKLPLVWEAACQAGQERCITEARGLFQGFVLNGVSINRNIRKAVYCNGLRYSTDVETDFNFLMNRLQTGSQPHETLYILLSLGCTTSRDHLIRLNQVSVTCQHQFLVNPDDANIVWETCTYLQQSLNSTVIRTQDFATVWSSVYSSNPDGVDIAFDFFTDNHESILSYYPLAASVLPAITSRFTTEAQISKLESLINQLQVTSTLRTTAEAALISARQNLQEQAVIRSNIEAHFGIGTYSSAVTFGSSILILSVSTLIIKYIC